MKRTKSLTLGALVVLLATGVVVSQAAVPGVTAQQTPVDSTNGFTVDSLDAPEAAGQDSNITVEAQITNNGSTQDTVPVEFRLDGVVVDQESVTLGPGETTNVSFSTNTDETEFGEVRHGVFTPSDGQLATLTIEESFVIDEFEAPDEVTAGEEVTVTTNIRNPGETNATQNVTFRLEGATVATEEVTLVSGENTTLEFDLPTDGVAPGVYVHSIFTRDFGQFDELNVTAAPNATATPAGNATATPAGNATATPAGNATATPTVTATPTATPAGNATATPAGNATATPAPAPNDFATSTPADNATATPTG